MSGLRIDSLEELTGLYGEPSVRAMRKQLTSLEKHTRRFIELTPFVVVATTGAHSMPDASPRGGAPGFIKPWDERTLLIPDSPGNNRLDSMRNIVETGKVGLIFMIPGVDETLRINGAAYLSRDPAHLAALPDDKRAPKLAIVVSTDEVYLHCPKAFMRSRLWEPAAQVKRSVLPSLGEMIRDQSGMEGPVESQDDMIARYKANL
jgi:uncharacterized protein